LAKDEGLSLVDVAFRWLCFHSLLREGDEIIIGGSSVIHIQSNLTALSLAEPLSPALLERVIQGWLLAQDGCAPYHR